ncbi:uncharacterized protein LOC114747221 [Neltuma alba]|uniref:uncharacterized protein LOC114747221 n=1 Tax=Neltuma alba TaxID=207710 RepID=UPI0010A2DBE6|nr:uncharacterized protein LOC114747221 [Prosopis alba]
MAAIRHHPDKSAVDEAIALDIKDCLDQHNALVKKYRMASEILRKDNTVDVRIRLLKESNDRSRNYELPMASEVAALIVGDFDESYVNRDIIIEKKVGSLKRVHELHKSYLPLQYPLIFHYGNNGFVPKTEHNDASLISTKKKKYLTIREYLAFILMDRNIEDSVLLHSKRLLQQFIIDGFAMVESERLDYIRRHQRELRVDLYKGLADAVTRGETDPSNTGKRIILPSSFTGEPCDKPKTAEDVDRIISAEIPDKDTDPVLYELVTNFMIHGPCGSSNQKSPCMKDGKCSKYVVPYNAQLLWLFQGHLNVEKTNQSRAIKYLFKYISKGHDRVIARIYHNDEPSSSQRDFDEISHYLNCRYISACEGAWRIFSFDIHRRYPSVERLSFHLPDQQAVFYTANDEMPSLVERPRVKESMFLGWLAKNKEDSFARTLTYTEFPQYYTFNKQKREWRMRQRGFSVSRLAHVSPSQGEAYYLQVLLTKMRGPLSYRDIRTVDNVVQPTFRAVCYALGLLQDDQEYIDAVKEAAFWATGQYLRRFFVSMLLCHCLSNPILVWEQTKHLICEDLLSLDDYPSLPKPSSTEFLDTTNNLLLQELSHDKDACAADAARLVASLTNEQIKIFHEVLNAVSRTTDGFYFVYSYGGTGKTFLWNALTAAVRANGDVVINVASSGIAATLLPPGRTAHSRFAIPIDINEDSTCNISHGSPVSHLLRSAKLIIWDEAPMIKRHCVEAVD